MITYIDKYAMACALNGTHDEMVKKALGAKDVAEMGASMFIPGAASALSGRDAFNAFRGGNKLEGVGHLALAGIGALPGIGGAASKLIRYGAKPLMRMGMPTFAKGVVGTAGKLHSVQQGMTGLGRGPGMTAFKATTPGKLLTSRIGQTASYGAATAGVSLPRVLSESSKATGSAGGDMLNAAIKHVPTGGYMNPMDIKPPGSSSMPFNPMASL